MNEPSEIRPSRSRRHSREGGNPEPPNNVILAEAGTK